MLTSSHPTNGSDDDYMSMIISTGTAIGIAVFGCMMAVVLIVAHKPGLPIGSIPEPKFNSSSGCMGGLSDLGVRYRQCGSSIGSIRYRDTCYFLRVCVSISVHVDRSSSVCPCRLPQESEQAGTTVRGEFSSTLVSYGCGVFCIGVCCQ